jgi:signal transduction histidine kinase
MIQGQRIRERAPDLLCLAEAQRSCGPSRAGGAARCFCGLLRELAHGILPAVLTRGGLRAGVDAVGTARPAGWSRCSGRAASAEIEASAYFVVAEALTNVVKHSHAGHAEVTGSLEDGMLRIEVRDNGAGGADPDGQGWWGCATG